jgi:hypothetical protein
MRYRRVAAALTTLAALLPLTACGIQQTDVIEAGGPATIDVLPAPESRMLLFFLSPDGVLIPVPRIVDDGTFGDEYRDGVHDSRDAPAGTGAPGTAEGTGVRPSTVKTVAALLAGPNETERRSGLYSALALPPQAYPKAVTPSRDAVDVDVPAPLGGLTEPARGQLVCTIAYAESGDGGVLVTLRGTDGALAPASCDLRPGPTATAGTDPG